MKIDVDESAKPPLGPIYPLSQSKVSALHEFIDEHLAMGLIHPSNSPFGALFSLLRRRMVLSNYVSISDSLMPSLGKTNTHFRLFLIC